MDEYRRAYLQEKSTKAVLGLLPPELQILAILVAFLIVFIDRWLFN